MNPKEIDEIADIYTFCITKKEYIKKSEMVDLMIFYEIVEDILNEYPKYNDKGLEVIKEGLKIIYKVIYDPNKFSEKLIKYGLYLDDKIKEYISSVKINKFIDFSEIDDYNVREINKLRIRIRILEAMFWRASKNLDNNGLYLSIPFFLNKSSKYIFYFIVKEFNDKLKFLEEKEINIDYNKERFEKLYNAYKKMNLKDFI